MRFAVLLTSLVAIAAARTGGFAPRFYDDDPVAREAETQDAGRAEGHDLTLVEDMVYHLFAIRRERLGVRAQDINTIDEVPDSSWFVNRAGARPLTPADVARGPDTTSGPAPGPWSIVSGKPDGISPGFVGEDAAGVRWFVKMDPREYPELASGAEVVSTKLLWALGYHVPENHVAFLRPDDLRIKPGATFKDTFGRKQRMRPRDVERLLSRAARGADGSYRVMASRALEGKAIGAFLFSGTRASDPNDVIPHEHRRSLRALRVFAAWLNHVDAKALNTLDTVVVDGGRTVIRHHLIDFGSTLGSAAVGLREYDEGHEYLYDPKPLVKAVFSAGLSVPEWRRIHYDAPPAVGRFTVVGFNPETWKPRIPNPAFIQAGPDDLFWAARKLAALSEPHIRAAVSAAKYSDPAAEQYLGNVLIARRRAILEAFLPAIGPIVDPALAEDGLLSFSNAAVDADVATTPATYVSSWYAYDNRSDTNTPLGHATATGTRLRAPAALPSELGAFVLVEVSAIAAGMPASSSPVHLYFRREAGGWRLVGVDRQTSSSTDAA